MKVSNKTYDTLKWVASIAFPAFITFVTTVGTAVNWEHTQLVAIILAAFNTLLGSLVGLSNRQYIINGKGDK